MATKLFVAGLAYAMTDDDLRNLFAEHGTVLSAQVITDRETRRSKGFGFVEMSTEDESKQAIAALNGKELDGRPITVNEARPREERPAHSFNNDRRGSMGDNFRRSRR
jgi:cold-inducible RNA-binding protein